jgi:hypothetical protein
MTESSFNTMATSSEGAKGLTQMTDIAAKEVRNQNPTLPNNPNLFDPETNITYGVLLLEHYTKQNNNIAELLANFNGGSRQANKLRNGEPLASETASYIPRVLDLSVCLDGLVSRGLLTGLPYEDIVDRVLTSRDGLFKRTTRQDFARQPVSLYGTRADRDPAGARACLERSHRKH